MRTAILAAVAILLSAPAAAQWVRQPAVGIPRLADGRPDAAAPVPRTSDGKPDLSGLWLLPLHPGYVANIAADLEPGDVQPWAAAVYDERIGNLGKDDPGTIGCLPLGPRHVTGGGTVSRVKIVQTPGLIVMLYEDLAYRQIFMDGRNLPPDPFPSFMGYSVGHWEGDELVVESIGFKERTWLDFGGHPHSQSLLITERYVRTSFGHMQRHLTIDDPKTFNRPIALQAAMTLEPDTELLEYICAETPADRFNLIGRTDDERQVKVDPELLRRYVGVYDVKEPNVFGIQTLTISLAGSRLSIDFNGKGRVPMMPMSTTMFSPRLLGTYEFVTGADGVVTHVRIHGIEGTNTAVRRR
jgi:hypothetical protein